MAGSTGSAPVRRRVGMLAGRATIAAGLALGALGPAGCTAPVTPVGTSGAGDRVVLLVTATTHEPRPMLTERALAELRAAAESDNVSDGTRGQGSVALVTTADGEFSELLALTPRRTNGAVEYGRQREHLIEHNLLRVSDTVVATRAVRPGLDLLQGLDDAVAGSAGGVLIVVSNGLSTEGGFDLRQAGWRAEPAQVVAQLGERDLLPELAGWQVLFTGLGATAGDQPPLPRPTRARLAGYWTAICEAAGAESCEVDGTRFERTPPAPGPAMPVVPIPDITSVTGPGGQVTTTISDRVLGFAGNSAVLSPAALDLLSETAMRITARLDGRPGAPVTVRGYTADPPGSTADGRRRLSRDRARAVADALAAAGVTNPVETVGGATAPGMSAVVHGMFDETRAKEMRRVEITY